MTIRWNMKTKKLDKKKIIEDLLKDREIKRNITFSFPESLLNKFKKECEKHDLKMNHVIEKLIQDFIEDK